MELPKNIDSAPTKESLREAKPLLDKSFPLPYQREGEHKGEGYLIKTALSLEIALSLTLLAKTGG